MDNFAFGVHQVAECSRTDRAGVDASRSGLPIDAGLQTLRNAGIDAVNTEGALLNNPYLVPAPSDEEYASGGMTKEEAVQHVLKLQARLRVEAKTDKPDTPATPMDEMTPEEASDFLRSLPKEELFTALDALTAQLFADEEEEEKK